MRHSFGVALWAAALMLCTNPGLAGEGDPSPPTDTKLQQRQVPTPEPAKERPWYFRIGAPQLSLLWVEDAILPGVNVSVEVEVDTHHIVSLNGWYGNSADGVTIGGGVGYAYEFEVFTKYLRLQLGAILGVAVYRWGDEIPGELFLARKEGITLLTVNPTLHAGNDFIAFSVGPRLHIGNVISGGLHAGATFRL